LVAVSRHTDEKYLGEAVRLAARTPARPWPNPPVGALVVKDGEVVGRGAHHGAGAPHAESVALAEAGVRARGATLYCTLEPCNHTGRTPPCAPVVLESGVQRVVVGVADPNPDVTGGGLRLLAANGVEVTVGVLAERTLDLIWPFAVTDAFARPFVLLKTATSLDGRFSLPGGRTPDADPQPIYLTGEEALRDGHRQRRWMDLVLVGEETVRTDRPRLDGRLVDETCECPAADPAAGYVDTDLSLAREWSPDRYLVFAGRESADRGAREELAAAGGRLVLCSERGGHVDPRSLLVEAGRLGIHCLMVEGGPRLAASFLACGAVDRWVQYRAPLFAGGGVQWPVGADEAAGEAAGGEFQLTSCQRLGRDLRLVYDRPSFAQTLALLSVEPEVEGRR